MQTVTLDDLACLLPTMGRQQVSVLTRSVLGMRTAAELQNVSLLNRLKAGIWEFMLAVGFVSDSQAKSVLYFVETALTDVIPILESSVHRKELPQFHITFAEKRWVSCPLQAQLYDMLYETPVPSMPSPAVLYVVCDVTALYLRQQAWLEHARSKDAGLEHHAPAGGVEAGRKPDGTGAVAAGKP